MGYGRMTNIDMTGNGADAVGVVPSLDFPGSFLLDLHGTEEGWRILLDRDQLVELLERASESLDGVD